MSELKALLILNGKRVNKDIMYQLRDQCQYILAADGATDYCVELGILPDLVLGDLDSISPSSLDILKERQVATQVFPVKKDKTDSQLSLEYLVDMGATEITIVGALGSRIDHSLANIFLLKTLKDRGVRGKIVGDKNTIYLIDDELILDKLEGHFVSIIPLDPGGATVSLEGFEYKLSKVHIDFASTHGISNFILDDKGYIKIHEGQCLVTVSRD